MISVALYDEWPTRIVLYRVFLVAKILRLSIEVISRREKDVISGLRSVVNLVKHQIQMILPLLMRLVCLKEKKIHKAQLLLARMFLRMTEIKRVMLIVIMVIIPCRIVFYRPCVIGKNIFLILEKQLHVLCSHHHHHNFSLRFRRLVKQEHNFSCLIQQNTFILLTILKFEHINKPKENDESLFNTNYIAYIYLLLLYLLIQLII